MKLLDYDLNLEGPIRPIAGEAPTGITHREWEIYKLSGALFTGERNFQGDLLQVIRSVPIVGPTCDYC